MLNVRKRETAELEWQIEVKTHDIDETEEEITGRMDGDGRLRKMHSPLGRRTAIRCLASLLPVVLPCHQSLRNLQALMKISMDDADAEGPYDGSRRALMPYLRQ